MKVDVKQISMFHYMLQQVLQWLEEDTGLEFTITSLHRPNDPGVHGTMPLRAVDLRCRYVSLGERLEGLINNRWQYDYTRPEKKVCIAHGEGRNFHLHIQVHPNTRLTGDTPNDNVTRLHDTGGETA